MRLENYDIEKLRGSLVAAAKRKLGGKAGYDYAADAEDLAQDALVELLEAPEGTDPFKLGKTIVEKDAMNLMSVEQRRRELEKEHQDKINNNVGSKFSGENPAEVLEAEDRLKRINTLTPVLRRALWQYTVEGLSYAELAEREGTSEEVMRKRVQRAREELIDE